MATRLQSLLSLVALLVRILLWPLQNLARLTFPAKDLDGLDPAVTSKAALGFVTVMRKAVSPQYTENWSTNGFAALQSLAVESQSLLLVYLHSPLHYHANHVMRHILCTPVFDQFLQQPHILAMGCCIHSGQGLQLSQILRAASFPVLALLQPSNSTLQLLLLIQGPLFVKMNSPATLVQHLNSALTRHRVQLSEQEARRFQQEQEAELRRQQDEEYHAALLQDQERHRQEREAEEERQRAEQEALEAEQRAREQEEHALQHARNLVRPPPTTGGVRIRFVLPSGKKVERRFESDETIGSLKAYLKVTFNDSPDDEGFERIGLSTNYPKQTYEDDSLTLEEAALGTQAVLMVQDLDA